MVDSLQFLFQAIAQAKNEQELRSQTLAGMREYFSATRYGLFFFDQIPLVDSNVQKAFQVALSGRTNVEIGAELWITENSVKQALKRLFRKLEVSSRAEMVAQLSASRRIFSLDGEAV